MRDGILTLGGAHESRRGAVGVAHGGVASAEHHLNLLVALVALILILAVHRRRRRRRAPPARMMANAASYSDAATRYRPARNAALPASFRRVASANAEFEPSGVFA